MRVDVQVEAAALDEVAHLVFVVVCSARNFFQRLQRHRRAGDRRRRLVTVRLQAVDFVAIRGEDLAGVELDFSGCATLTSA